MNMILGLTCISEELKEKDKKKYSFRTMTRKRFNDLCVKDGRDEAINELSTRILHNVRTTRYIIRHCIHNNILHYRLSSALFPLITDQSSDVSYEDLPNRLEIEEELAFAGKIAKQFKLSIGSHPDQFVVLASANENAVKNSINELNFQANIFDMIGLPQDHTAPMNIHINYSPKGDETLEDVAERFFNNLMKCNPNVYNRLTIENEDKGFFNVDNILLFSDYIFLKYNFNLPVCYDNLHDFCNPSEERNIIFQAERCAYTWAEECSPVFHWSEGTPEKPRAHAEYFALGNIPPIIAINPNQEAKWECEVKGKDKAIRLLRKNLDIS
jgi:UV DNA damage endonuclease